MVEQDLCPLLFVEQDVPQLFLAMMVPVTDDQLLFLFQLLAKVGAPTPKPRASTTNNTMICRQNGKLVGPLVLPTSSP